MIKKFLIIFFLLNAAVLLAVTAAFVKYSPAANGQAEKTEMTASSTDWNIFQAAKEKFSVKPAEASLIFVGDISFSRGIERQVKKNGDNNFPLALASSFLQSADLVVANLETPITKGREIATGEMVFRSNPGTEKALKAANISLVSLANNHTPNFGQKGLADTFDYLKSAGIEYVGAGQNEAEAYRPEYVNVNGLKFAFLAYTDSDFVPASYVATKDRAGTAFMDNKKMAAAVKEAKKNADFVIVSMHSGKEYVLGPTEKQKSFAQAAIAAGADLVIGHHPHVVEPVEKYQGKYILYSLGNFVFDQSWSENTMAALTAKVIFRKDGISRIELRPVKINNSFQPQIISAASAESTYNRLGVKTTTTDEFFWNQSEKGYDPRSYWLLFDSPSPDQIINRSEKKDLNNNQTEEEYNLAGGILRVRENGLTVWETPSDWWVDDFVLADSDNDGKEEINLLVWKQGNYGPARPFWEKENDESIKNHFFVFSWESDKIKSKWQSSNLDNPNCQALFKDIDGDRKNELVVLEGDYQDSPSCHGQYWAVWEWNGWGFSNGWRSPRGNFSNLGYTIAR